MSEFLTSGISSPWGIAAAVSIGSVFAIVCVLLALRVAAKEREQLTSRMQAANEALRATAKTFDLNWVEPMQNKQVNSLLIPSLGKVRGQHHGLKAEISTQGDSDGDYRTVLSLEAPPGKQFRSKTSKASPRAPVWAYIFDVTPSKITIVPRVPLITTWSGGSYRIISDAAELKKVFTDFSDLAKDLLIEG